MIDDFDYACNNPKETGKHMGKWIIVYNNKIVASNKDLIKIYKEFQKNNPKAVPLVLKIPTQKENWWNMNRILS